MLLMLMLIYFSVRYYSTDLTIMHPCMMYQVAVYVQRWSHYNAYLYDAYVQHCSHYDGYLYDVSGCAPQFAVFHWCRIFPISKTIFWQFFNKTTNWKSWPFSKKPQKVTLQIFSVYRYSLSTDALFFCLIAQGCTTLKYQLAKNKGRVTL